MTGSALTLRSRFVGCLLGGALGDALGFPIAFKSRDEILEAHGAEPPARLAFAGAPPALVSDATQMTMFTAEGLIRGFARNREAEETAPILELVRDALLRWRWTQSGGPLHPAHEPGGGGWLIDERRLRARRASGPTCLEALARQRTAGTLPTTAAPPNHSKGCRAIVRSAPPGLVGPAPDAAFALARDAAALTHGHPSGYLSAAAFAAIVFGLSRGQPIEDAAQAACALLERERGHDETLGFVRRAFDLAQAGTPSHEAIEHLGGGWTGEEALAIALACVATADVGSPAAVRAILWRAACHSGDSASSASLAGSFLGAVVGREGLPAEWLEELELRDAIERLATDLHAAAIEDAELDETDYPPW